MSLSKKFSIELQDKLIQKSGANVSSEAQLVKTIKYYDVQGLGYIDFRQFQKSMEKLGFQYDDRQMKEIFNTFDTDGSHTLDYREFVKMVLGQDAAFKGQVMPKRQKTQQEVMALVAETKRMIMKRGARGIVGIQRLFKICDDDGSGQLDKAEFTKACRQFKLEVGDEQINDIFQVFDGDKSGTISFDEFLRVIKGDLNEQRTDLVEQAFKKLDKDNSGMLEVQDIIGTYDAKKHPAVLQGRKTENEVLEEFLSTFEQHHNNLKGQGNDFKISIEEFKEYYTNIGASIDDDAYFAQMMNSAWNLKGDAAQYKKYKKGWAGEESNGQPTKGSTYQYENVDPTGKPTLHSGQMSAQNPFSNISEYYGEQGPQKKRNSMANDYRPKPNNTNQYLNFTGLESKTNSLGYNFNGQNYEKYMNENKVSVTGHQKADNSYAVKAQVDIDKAQLKEKIAERGAKGIVGLKKQFKLMDTDGSGQIDFSEFISALADFKIDIPQAKARNVFQDLDSNGGGTICFQEFLDGVIGALSPMRKRLCEEAFQSLDANGSGTLEMVEVKDCFEGTRHPECISGEKTAEQCKFEFLNLFKMHQNSSSSGENSITLDEFTQYHQILSTFYLRDTEFRNFLIGVWNMDLKPLEKNIAGGPPRIYGKNSREHWKFEQHKSLYGERMLDDGYGGKVSENIRKSGPAGSALLGFGQKKAAKSQRAGTAKPVNNMQRPKSQNEILQSIRYAILRRGTQGINGVKRSFKQVDLDKSGTLNYKEFVRALKNYRIDIDEEAQATIFKLFDADGNKEISYEEFIQGVIGKMNGRRQAVVKAAFQKLDRDGSGGLTVDEVKSCYNVKAKPSVREARETEDDALYAFLDQFDTHVMLGKGNDNNREVSLAEFIDYYNCVSCSIESDYDFEQEVALTWGLI